MRAILYAAENLMISTLLKIFPFDTIIMSKYLNLDDRQ